MLTGITQQFVLLQCYVVTLYIWRPAYYRHHWMLCRRIDECDEWWWWAVLCNTASVIIGVSVKITVSPGTRLCCGCRGIAFFRCWTGLGTSCSGCYGVGMAMSRCWAEAGAGAFPSGRLGGGSMELTCHCSWVGHLVGAGWWHLVVAAYVWMYSIGDCAVYQRSIAWRKKEHKLQHCWIITAYNRHIQYTSQYTLNFKL
jgi:hypothetical protein